MSPKANKTREHCVRHEARSSLFNWSDRSQRTHTNEKPYQCSICLTNFTRADSLTRHMKIHASAADDASSSGSNSPDRKSSDATLQAPRASTSRSTYEPPSLRRQSAYEPASMRGQTSSAESTSDRSPDLPLPPQQPVLWDSSRLPRVQPNAFEPPFARPTFQNTYMPPAEHLTSYMSPGIGPSSYRTPTPDWAAYAGGYPQPSPPSLMVGGLPSSHSSPHPHRQTLTAFMGTPEQATIDLGGSSYAYDWTNSLALLSPRQSIDAGQPSSSSSVPPLSGPTAAGPSAEAPGPSALRQPQATSVFRPSPLAQQHSPAFSDSSSVHVRSMPSSLQQLLNTVNEEIDVEELGPGKDTAIPQAIEALHRILGESNMLQPPARPPPHIVALGLHSFFRKFSVSLPIYHAPTFSVSSVSSVELLNIVALGSLFVDNVELQAHGHALETYTRFALWNGFQRFITDADSARAACVAMVLSFCCHRLIDDTAQLEYITQCYSIVWSWLSLAALDTRALPLSPLAGIDPARLPTLDTAELESVWRRWARAETIKRSTMAAYMNDSLVVAHTRRSAHVRHFAITTYEACTDAAWLSPNAAAWAQIYQHEANNVWSMRDIYIDLCQTYDTAPPSAWPRWLPKSTYTCYMVVEALTVATTEMHLGRGLPGTMTERQLLHAQLALRRSYSAIKAAQPYVLDTTDIRVRWNAGLFAIFADIDLIITWACSLGSPAGPDPALVAHLRQWAASPTARRAILHCVATKRLFEVIPRGREPGLHVPPSVLSAFLVLHTWRRLAPPETVENADLPQIAIDHAESIDWQLLGHVGCPGAQPSDSIEGVTLPAQAAFVTGDAIAILEGQPLTRRRLPPVSALISQLGRGVSSKLQTALRNLEATEPGRPVSRGDAQSD